MCVREEKGEEEEEEEEGRRGLGCVMSTTEPPFCFHLVKSLQIRLRSV